MGDVNRAVNDISRSIELKPDNPVAWQNRATLRVKKGDLTVALADYNQAIRLDPESPDAFADRGKTHMMLGRMKQGIADLERALRVAPAKWKRRGEVEKLLRKMKERREDK